MPTPTDVDIWPPLGVRLAVSDIELSAIDDGTAIEVARNVYTYQSGLRARCGPDRWTLEFAARLDGTLIGLQALDAEDFPTTRSAESGSWLGREVQGRGIGTLLRIAILSFAFDGLGAAEVRTSAWSDNSASNAV